MKRALIAFALPFALVACGGGSDADTADTPMEEPAGNSVTIVTPMNGAQIAGTQINVNLSSTVTILPAGDLTEGTGHHHLYLNAELTPADQPVPTVPGSIVHMGDASSSYTFEDVEPGEYTLIAVVADGVHVPLQPWVVDTVTFTVVAGN